MAVDAVQATRSFSEGDILGGAKHTRMLALGFVPVKVDSLANFRSATTFFRSMSWAEYDAFQAAKNQLTFLEGTELFITTRRSYAQRALKFDDSYHILVKFETNPGTMPALEKIGARVKEHKLIEEVGLGHLPIAKSEWGKNGFVLFKKEGKGINIGLGPNPGTFNENIIQHEIIQIKTPR